MSFTPEVKEKNDLDILKLLQNLREKNFDKGQGNPGYIAFRKGKHKFEVSRIRAVVKYTGEKPGSDLSWEGITVCESLKFLDNLKIE